MIFWKNNIIILSSKKDCELNNYFNRRLDRDNQNKSKYYKRDKEQVNLWKGRKPRLNKKNRIQTNYKRVLIYANNIHLHSVSGQHN